MTRTTKTTNDGVVGAETVLRISTGEPPGELVETVEDAAEDVPVEVVGSTGVNAFEPLLLATADGTTLYYPSCSTERAHEVARSLAADWTPPGDGPAVDHEPTAMALPVPDAGPLAVGERAVLGRAGWVVPTSLADHEASGGLTALEVAEQPDEALSRLGGLTGRGWGDAAADGSVAELWATARDADGEPAVVVDGHGAPQDRLLLESSPLSVLEGAAVAARVVGATDVFVYVNEADGRAREAARAAAEAFAGAADDLAVDVVAGPDEYKAAEPTMALEAIEGNHRLEARRSPPGPAEYGLFGRPTLVHTPRTLAHVERAVAGRGGDTRLLTVTGDVESPATVEVREGQSLSSALDAVDLDGAFKAACVGGRFGGVTADLDVAASPEALSGAGLGTEGVVEVLAEGRCLVAFAGDRAAFAEAENCGRCVPCREGSTQLTRLLREVYDGEYRPDAIAELARVMTASSICEFGVQASRPATTAMATFEDEFQAHAEGTCPTGECDAADAPTEPTGPMETPT